MQCVRSTKSVIKMLNLSPILPCRTLPPAWPQGQWEAWFLNSSSSSLLPHGRPSSRAIPASSYNLSTTSSTPPRNSQPSSRHQQACPARVISAILHHLLKTRTKGPGNACLRLTVSMFGCDFALSVSTVKRPTDPKHADLAREQN
jgi:hypothetical protein